MVRLSADRKKTWEKIKMLSQTQSIEDKLKQQWLQAEGALVDEKMRERIWRKIDPKREKRTGPLLYMAYRVAAIAAVVALVIGGCWFMNESKVEEFVEIASIKNELYVLPDSSKVWMQAGSHIRYRKDFVANREVWVKGETLFDVAKHQGSTFKVFLDKSSVIVRGTTFLIRENDEAKQEVTLFQGKIDFNMAVTNRSIQMKPMQRIIFNPADNHFEIQTIDNMNWNEGRFVFNDIGLGALIKVINQTYNGQIIIGKEVSSEDKFSGSFAYDEPLDSILRKICYSVNLTQHKEGDRIIID